MVQDYNRIVTNPECCLRQAEERSLCTCAYDELFSVIGKKWAVLLLNILRSSSASSYNNIFRKISGITPKAFGDKLRLLEEKGLIERKVVQERPSRTAYSLTAQGEQLVEKLKPFLEQSGESQ